MGNTDSYRQQARRAKLIRAAGNAALVILALAVACALVYASADGVEWLPKKFVDMGFRF